jgi:general secretion pathway protein N
VRASSLTALGLAAYSVFLVATIPAAYVVAHAQAALRGQVELDEASGTLWNGSARARIAPTRGGPTLERIEWRFLPTRLAFAEIAFAARVTSLGVQGTLEAARTLSQWRVREANLAADASAVASWIPIFATWRPTGPLKLAAPKITIEGREVRGNAEIEWRDAAIGLSEVRPLGSYRATWRAENGPGTIEVATLQGPLRVTGRGTTTPALRFTFTGEARSDPQAAAALEPLLNLIGPRRPDGSRALEAKID